jgi:hypothetical protein
MRSDDDFETVLDHNGRRVRILKDGGRCHVPLMFRDGVNPALTSMQRSVASRRQLSDAELASCRPGFRYGGRRAAADRQALYDAYDKEISDAYLKPLGFGTDPALTGAGSRGPRQEPPAGSPCTKNGWPGAWRRDDGGQMVCDITAAGRADAKAQLRSRIDPDEDEEEDDDRPSVAQATSDHQQRMARLYDSYDAELRERWRLP